MRVPRALSVLLLGLALTACGSSVEQQAPSDEAPAHPQPTSLRIPSIGVDAQNIITLGIQGPADKQPGAMQVPDIKQPMLLGWYCPLRPQVSGEPAEPASADPNALCGAPAPGEVGPAVLAGHVNGNGHDGVFAKLAKVRKGEVIEIDRSDRQTAVFTVTAVETPLKANFPTVKVYSDTAGPELRLITCGGGTNELETLPDGTRSYKHQTIVYAKLSELKPRT